MILLVHADAGFINKSKSCSRSGAHIFLSENDPNPKLNGPVLTISLITKYVMASEDEAEMAVLYIIAKNIIPLGNTLIEMGCPQPKSPIQTDNSTAVGFTNKTIVSKANNLADMKLWWIRDREQQDQLRYYWAPGSENEGYYSTKHNPTIYNVAKRSNPYLV